MLSDQFWGSKPKITVSSERRMCIAISLHVNLFTPSSGMNILMHAVTDRLQDLTGGGQLPQAVTEPDNLSYTPIVLR